MAFLVATGQLVHPTASVTLPARFSSTEPLKAVWLQTVGTTADDTGENANALWVDGFVTKRGGTIQQVFRHSNEQDAQATMVTQRGINNTNALRGMLTDTTYHHVGSVTAANFTNTGFTITWATAPPTGTRIQWMAFGGSDCLDAEAFLSNLTSTSGTTASNVALSAGMGRPDLVILGYGNGGITAASDGVGGYSGIGIGMFTKAGGVACAHHLQVDAAGTSTVTAYNRPKAISTVGATASPTTFNAEMTPSAESSWPTDGFQLVGPPYPNASTRICGLAIRASSTINFEIVGDTSNTTAASDTLALSSGDLIGAAVWGANVPETTTPDSTHADLGSIACGFFSGVDGTQHTVAITSDDAATDSFCGRWSSASAIMCQIVPPTVGTSAGTLAGKASASKSGGNLVINWAVDPDTIARRYWALLIGGPSDDSTPPTVDVSLVTQTTISRVVGADASDVTFTTNEAYTAYQVRVVPSSVSPVTAGTLVESGTGGTGAAHTVTITDDEFVAAGAIEGTNTVKVFTQDAAGNWST